MRAYYYTDGFRHISSGNLTASQIISDESTHGKLVAMANEKGERILCYYNEKGGTPTWPKKN